MVHPGVDHRWRRLNLTANPMSALGLADRTRVAVVDPDPMLAALRRVRGAVEIIGPRGRGKTTLALTLADRLRRDGTDIAYHYCPPDGPVPPIVDADWIVVDEIERLPRSVRRELFAGDRRLIWTTHHSFRRAASRHGRKVTRHRLPKYAEPARWAEIVRRRIEHHRWGDGPLPRTKSAELIRLSNEARGDVRAVLDCLYDRFEHWSNAVR